MISELKKFSKSDIWFNRYVKLIEYAKENITESEYIHKHHILPRSLFPEYINRVDNIIPLTYRLHYLAHYILWKMTDTLQMALAFHFMSTHTIKNSRLYHNAIKELYDHRKGYVAAKNIMTGVNELTKVENLGVTHIHTSTGKKWWTNNDGNTIFTDIDMTENGYKNTHNNPCAPTKVYWTLDENGKRCRTENKSDKIKGVAPWEAGFNKINKESTKFINLKTKEIVYINKNDIVPAHHYAANGLSKNTIVYLYKNTYYFGHVYLPREINKERKILPDELHSIIIPTVDSPIYKQKNISSAKKELIETYGGQSFYDAGVRAYYLYSDSFIYDKTNSINNSEVKCTHSK